jgi:voltage-gated potassium channel
MRNSVAAADQHELTAPESTAVNRWEKRTEWPLALLAVAFLGSYAWPILDQNLSAGWRQTCRWTGYLVWLAFLVDFVIRVALAANRGRYVSRHLLDPVIIVLPVLRPLRLLADRPKDGDARRHEH